MTCPRSSLRGALSVLSLCVLSLGSLRVASAAPQRPRLAVHRAPSAADCPDAPSLAAAVERVMKQPALDPVSTLPVAGDAPAAAGDARAVAGDAPAVAGGAPAAAGGLQAASAPAPSPAGDAPSSAGAAPPGAGSAASALPEYEVHFLRTETTYTAVLQADGRARQLSSEAGASCGELVEALALTIAILLDSEPAPAPPPPVAPAPPPAAPAPVMPARRPAPPPPPSQPRSWDVAAELGAAGTVGMLDPFRAAAMGGVSLRRRAWSAGLGAVWLPHQDIDVEPGVASIGLVAATARGCATIAGELDEVRLSACAASMLGAVHGAGRGFTPNREDSALWFALGASAIAEGPLFGARALGWFARATLLAPVARARFTVDRRADSEAGAPVTTDAVLDPSPVGLLVGLGARVSIF
ncbi:hypothetical protein [Sorangium cellulosum]|uniref:Secreted protein n=1 Tax=Sorangium cellulosum TaxID=56 RepID=A0A150PYI5_SORCE|nr:hypothetical protein [Sorangium cellulosum]KYF60831.1 hypothetical protein BE15_31465 [Sorangium cellulosum]